MTAPIPQTKEPDPRLVRAVTLPITGFNPGKTPRLRGKEERLKAMIANLDKHHATIRTQIKAMPPDPSHPIIAPSSQITPSTAAAFDTFLRVKDYDNHAAEHKRLLTDMLRKYEARDGTSNGTIPAVSGSRSSIGGGGGPTAPSAFMAPMAPMSTRMEGVERTGVAPVAPMMGAPPPAPAPRIDASRDPRRR